MLPGKTYGVQDYLALAKRYWWIVVATTSIGAFSALVVASSQQDAYQSEMLIQIVPQRVPDRLVPTTVTTRTEDRMDSLEAQVKSRSQLERLIREFNLYAQQRALMPMEDVVDVMRLAIDVELVRPAAGRHLPADAFYVRFTYAEADVAARVTSSLGNLFIAENSAERKGLAEGTNEFLAKQLVDADSKLRAQEQRVERFRQLHAGRLPTQSDFNLQAIQTTQAQVQTVAESAARDRDRRQMLERLYNDAAAQPVAVRATGAPTPGDPGSAATLPLPQQLSAARTTLERLEARLTDQHPDVKRQRKLVADLEQKVAAASKERGNQPAAADVNTTDEELQRRERLSTMKAEIESLGRQIAYKEAEEKKLRAVVSDYQRRLEATPGVESEWIALNRDYETLKTSYEDLLRKSQDSKMAAALESQQIGEQFRIVDSARVPVRPVGAVRLRTNAAGTAAGLMLGLLVVGFLFMQDTTFYTEADVLDVLALPVLALVPHVVAPDELQRRRRRQVIVASVVTVVVGAGVYVAWAKQLWRFVT